MTFLFGAVAAGLVFGGVLGALGTLPGGERVANACLLAAIVMSIAERMPRSRLRPPSSGWQIPREWRVAGRCRISLVFGLALGLGVVTIVTSWTTYVILAGAMAQAGFLGGATVLGAFGLARGLPMILVAADPRAQILPSGGDTMMMLKIRRIAGLMGGFRWAETALIGFVGGGALSGFLK